MGRCCRPLMPCRRPATVAPRIEGLSGRRGDARGVVGRGLAGDLPFSAEKQRLRREAGAVPTARTESRATRAEH